MFSTTIRTGTPAQRLRRVLVFILPLLTVATIVGFLALGWTSVRAQDSVSSWYPMDPGDTWVYRVPSMGASVAWLIQ